MASKATACTYGTPFRATLFPSALYDARTEKQGGGGPFRTGRCANVRAALPSGCRFGMLTYTVMGELRERQDGTMVRGNRGECVRILMAEDHGLVAEAFVKLLEPEFEVVGTVGDGQSLLRVAKEVKPDVVLLDLYLPGVTGLEAGAALKRAMPRIKILVVTVNDEVKTAVSVLNTWASGYLLKRSMGSELTKAIREVMRGGKYVTPALGKDLDESWQRTLGYKPERSLTARQRQVLGLLADGCTMKEAAAILKVTARTVAFHKYRIMREFNVKTNTQLMRFAIRERVVGPN
jgi:DNA-binding NarL/FixJ family response regulator